MRACRHALVIALVGACLAARLLAAAQTAPVDFDRDVRPILREKCLGCHAGTQAQAGLRLDERQRALVGSNANGIVIVPGNSARSRLVWRISGHQYGPQMPPTGALTADQIEIIKRWIDEGLPWPEAQHTARLVDPRVTRLADAFRDGDRAAIARAAVDPAAINAFGADGQTPLLAAALYGTADDVRGLIAKGADVNLAGDDGLTPLLLSAADTAKIKALLDAGADPNRRSADGRTALHVAAQRGATDAVRLLLARGASTNYQNGDSPLVLAAATGDPEIVDVLMQAGAPVTRQAGIGAVYNAAAMDCLPCLDMLAREAEPVALGAGLDVAAGLSSVATVKKLLDKGAPVEATDLFGGGTPLMFAASSDRDALAKVKLLLEHGADARAKSDQGETALDLAKMRGDRAVVEALGSERGVTPPSRSLPAAPPSGARAAVERSIALLQKSDAQFVKSTGCISCHHQVLPQMVTTMADRKGLQFDRDAAASEFKAVVTYLDDRRTRAVQGLEINGGADTLSYLLADLDAHGYQPSPTTDAWARYLGLMQLADGHWRIQALRPPIESTDIMVTAMSARAIKRYAPASDRAAYDARVRAAGEWLAKTKATTGEERAFRLLGLSWAGAPHTAVADAARELRAAQRPDGGWSQLDPLESDAYSTGQALVALHEAGGLTIDDPIYQKGVHFLLATQHDDGSWLVRSRAIALQPVFDSGFPGGRDQWISAAGTAWAAMALVAAIP